MKTPKTCEGCGKLHDFENECSGSCGTCKKQYMCYACCWTHQCIEGKISRLSIITNPNWIANLRETLK